MNEIERVNALMLSDDEDSEKQSHYLRRAYLHAGTDGRSCIDEAFIALCGYSLKNIMEDCKNAE